MYLSIFTDELGVDFREALETISSWGLSHVDFRGGVLGSHFEQLDTAQLEEVKALLAGYGLKVGCLESSLAKVHLPDKERRDEEKQKLESIIRAAEMFDCRLVRSFFYWQPPEELKGELAVRPDELQKVLDMFAPLAERAGEAGLVIGFENCGVTTPEVFAVLKALGEPRWGLAWDVANEWHTSDLRAKDEAAYTGRLARSTRIVHVKATGAVAGVGEPIPYDRVLQTLDNSGYEGPVSIETHNPDPSADNVGQSHNVLAALRRAWPSAAPGSVEEASRPAGEVQRDYAPVGFVVVGLGMGRSRARMVIDTPGTRLLGVVDIDEERARIAGEELDVPWTLELEPWLDNDEVEVVYVLTPTGLHAEVGLKALAAGKHVLTTKPMEASIEACDAMIRLSEERSVLLGVDFGMRFQPEVLSLKAAVENGALGRMLGGQQSLKVLRKMEYFRANGGWRGTRKLDGGGVFSNQNIHHLDQLAFVLGIPQMAKCEIWTQGHDIEAEDLGCALLKYPDGAVVELFATTCYPHSTWYVQLELHGTEGAVSLSSGGPLESARSRWFLDGVWMDEPPQKVKSEWLNAADNFAAALRTGAALMCSGRDGRRTQAVLDAMYRSAYGDRDWVEVEPELPD